MTRVTSSSNSNSNSSSSGCSSGLQWTADDEADLLTAAREAIVGCCFLRLR